MASNAGAQEKTKVAVAKSLRPGEEAADAVLAQLDHGEAPIVGLLGDTGTGKTTALQRLVDRYLKKSGGSVFIIDDKELRPRFLGQSRKDVKELRDNPIDPEAGRVIVFRGEPSRGELADPEEITALAWKRVQRGRKTLVVVDELVAGRGHLTKNAQWRKGVEFLPKSFTAGRAVGVATFWGAQSPQMVPVDPFEQSNAIICFRLAGMGLAKLKERNYLDGGADVVIPQLHGPPAPPAERGDFVLLQRGLPWNGLIYKFAMG
jgi:ABC-type cobalamin/Fe3+-siderophores transport system ATPase subunit